MDYNQVKELIKTVQESNLTEFTLKMGGMYVKMKKGAEEKIPIRILKEEAPEEASKEAARETVPAEGRLFHSPLVGTYYESSSPDKPSFVKVGDKVSKGNVLCIVEAMKVMNEITSDQAGEIAEILVKNEEMVEYGQPLFRIV